MCNLHPQVKRAIVMYEKDRPSIQKITLHDENGYDPGITSSVNEVPWSRTAYFKRLVGLITFTTPRS